MQPVGVKWMASEALTLASVSVWFRSVGRGFLLLLGWFLVWLWPLASVWWRFGLGGGFLLLGLVSGVVVATGFSLVAIWLGGGFLLLLYADLVWWWSRISVRWRFGFGGGFGWRRCLAWWASPAVWSTPLVMGRVSPLSLQPPRVAKVRA